MRPRFLAPTFATFALLSFAPASGLVASTPEQRGLEIAQMADQAQSGFKTERATMLLELINAHGEVTKRQMRMEVLEGKDDGDKSRAEFEWPADVKGTKLLTFTHKKGDDDQWLYLPSVKRVKRISGSSKTGSFMGSEFSFEDLASQEVEKFTYRYLGDVKENGRDCYQIERFPVDKNSGYKRQVVWMDKEYLSALRIDYYDRKNELLKTAQFVDYRKFGKLWRPGGIRIINVQTKKRSNLTWDKRELGVPLPTERFDSAALED